MDIIDLLNGAANPAKSSYTAPFELMSEFLLLITSEKYAEALVLSDQILEYEPNNVLILEYRKSLESLVVQDSTNLSDSEDDDEEDDEEDENNEDDSRSTDSENSDEDEEEEDDDNETKTRDFKSTNQENDEDRNDELIAESKGIDIVNYQEKLSHK